MKKVHNYYIIILRKCEEMCKIDKISKVIVNVRLVQGELL